MPRDVLQRLGVHAGFVEHRQIAVAEDVGGRAVQINGLANLLEHALIRRSRGRCLLLADDIAGFLGITDVLSKFPAQMSGGQKQRVAAARSLISDPDIILADEPTGALDTKAARLLMEKLQEVNQVQGRTILMVTHDPNAASFCSRILFIQDGVIFHELRRKVPTETREEFYARILQVMAQMGGGSANVL